MAVTASKKVKENEGGQHRARPMGFQRERGPDGPSYFIPLATGNPEGLIKGEL